MTCLIVSLSLGVPGAPASKERFGVAELIETLYIIKNEGQRFRGVRDKGERLDKLGGNIQALKKLETMVGT